MTTTTATFHKVNPITLASWSTAPYAGPCPNPDPTPEPDEDGPEKSDGYKLLDTQLTRQAQGRCVNCGKRGHITWQCVEIGDLLFARP